MRALRVVGWLVLAAVHLVAIAAIGGGLAERSAERPVAGGSTAAGTVVGVRDDCGRGHCFHSPVVAFTTADGRSARVVGHDSNHEPVLGSPRTVSYRPGDLADARVLDPGADWVVTVSVGAGALALLVAYDVVLLRRRSARPA